MGNTSTSTTVQPQRSLSDEVKLHLEKAKMANEKYLAFSISGAKKRREIHQFLKETNQQYTSIVKSEEHFAHLDEEIQDFIGSQYFLLQDFPVSKELFIVTLR